MSDGLSTPPWRKPAGNLAAIYGGAFRPREPEPEQRPEDAFLEHVRAAGLDVDHVVGDGRLHRVRTTEDRRAERSGWYVLYMDGVPSGACGDWRDESAGGYWCARDVAEMPHTERAEHEARMAALRKMRDDQREKDYHEAAERAMSAMQASQPAPDDHPYLVAKGVRSHGLRVDDQGRLLMPLVDAIGTVRSLQTIAADGTKRFLPGGRTGGCWHVIGGPLAGTVYVVEGYSTGATVHEATGCPVVVAHSAGNLTPVARALRKAHPSIALVIAADNDRHKDTNAGVEQGRKAAEAANARLVVPEFSGDEGTDWNDLARLEGAEAVRGQLRADVPRPAALLQSASRWSGRSVPEREWLLYEWIPMRQTTGLYGDGGTGKSLLAQQLATCVATGRPFMGLQTRTGPVVYLACEDDEDELHRRQDAINRWLGIGYADLRHLHLVSRVGEDNILFSFDRDGSGAPTPLWHALDEALGAVKPAMFVPDTAADVFGGNEIIRGQVRQFLQQACTGLAVKHNCACLLPAHPSAAGLQSGTGTGGSTAWNNTLRSRLYFERDSIMPNARTLTRKKANYAASDDVLTVHWAAGCFWQEGSRSEQRTREDVAKHVFLAGMYALTHKRMQNLSDHPRGNYAPKQIATLPKTRNERLGIKPLEHAMNELLDAGLIAVQEYKGDGRTHLVLTPEGMDYLQKSGLVSH